MKIKVLLCLLLCATLAMAQQNSHQLIPGTKISLVPPPGFLPSSNFSGFQDPNSGASIMATEIPAPAQEVISGFTAEALKPRGMILLSKEALSFNGSDALFVKVSQKANATNYLKVMVIFGDAQKTILVNGIYPESSAAIEADVKAAILSAIYTENADDDPLAAAKFKLDVSGTKFQFAKYISGALLYTSDGKVPTEAKDGALFIASNSLNDVNVEDKEQYAINRLRLLPNGENYTIKTIKPLSINGIDGFEIIADGTDAASTTPLLMYQVMLFDEQGSYYLLLGSALGDNQDLHLNTFQQIAKTFERK